MALPPSTQHLEAALRRAIDERQLVVHYQPIIDLHAERMVAVEALVRWRHPTRGLLYPETFLDLAEQTGLVHPLGAWVLGEACGLSAAWSMLPPDRTAAAGHRQLDTAELVVSVNVSPSQLAADGFVDGLVKAIAIAGAVPDHLQLEVSASLPLADPGGVAHAVGRLHELGVRVVLDEAVDAERCAGDLHRWAADALKVDGRLVRELNGTDRGRSEVAALVALAHDAGATAVAVGVETDGQLEAVRSLGCDQAQGFRLASPVPARLLRPH